MGGAPLAPIFYYDLVSPDAYLALERLVEVLGVVPELRPVSWSRLGFAPAPLTRDPVLMASVERRAQERGLQPIRWPAHWPGDTDLALRVATYAAGIGKLAAYSLAAFRQAFAGGRELAEPDTVLLAAAACEMHPRAVLAAVERRSVRARLELATREAAAAGVRALPALTISGRAFEGDERLEDAAAALAAAAR